MKLYSLKEMSKLWGLSDGLLRRYCRDGRIPSAVLEDGSWWIPEGTEKPKGTYKKAPAPVLYIGYSYTYGVPGVGGTAQLSSETNASSVILPAIGALYRRIVNPAYGIRRVCLSCNNVVADHGNLQLNMFEDATKQLRNKALQEAMLEIRYKYGKNSILRGISYTPASTARERNNQIGGHKSGNEDSKGAHAKVKTG